VFTTAAAALVAHEFAERIADRQNTLGGFYGKICAYRAVISEARGCSDGRN